MRAGRARRREEQGTRRGNDEPATDQVGACQGAERRADSASEPPIREVTGGPSLSSRNSSILRRRLTTLSIAPTENTRSFCSRSIRA